MWEFVRPYRLHLALTAFLVVCATPLSLLAPLPVKIAVDSVIGAHPAPAPIATLIEAIGAGSIGGRLAVVAALLIVVTLLIYGQGLVAWIAQTWLGEKLALDLRAALFRHAQRLSLAYHDRTGTTDSIYRIQYDAQSLQFVVVNALLPLLSAVLTLCGMIAVTAWIDLQLALVALSVCPALYWITRRFNSRLKARWYEVKRLDSSAMSVVQETLCAVRVVKAFGQEDREERRFLGRSEERLAGQLDLARIQGKFDLAVGMTIAAGTAIALVIGVLHCMSGRLTVGQLFMVMAYLTQIYEPLKTISKKSADLQSGIVSAERALALLNELPDVAESANARSLARARGHFRLEDLGFAYETERPILRNVNLDIPPGSRVGIRGQTGAGKSTLISLLMRFYDATSGKILFDGHDLREYRVRDLRDQFALVLQDPILFSTTIAENIAYGRPNAARDEIIQAARDANAHEFIMGLPDGYETKVGERGMRLSGGERQRVSIARAFLKDAPVLLLDEPTSSVDSRTEASIMEAMERLMRRRTVFMIAHRLSTLRTCDLQIELADSELRLLGAAQWAEI
jgi:ATP-binding cassette subfamily B protein